MRIVRLGICNEKAFEEWTEEIYALVLEDG